MGTTSTPPSASPIESYVAALSALLAKIIRYGGFELTFDVRRLEKQPEEVEAPEVVIELSGPDADLLLQRNAELLDALEYVLFKAVRLAENLFGKITLDCGDWRRTRAEELRLTAQMAAEQVAATGRPFSLNPMSPRERRIVHLTLKPHANVRTASEGLGRHRKVVIHPASSSSPVGPSC